MHDVDILEEFVISLVDGIGTMYFDLIIVYNVTLGESGFHGLVQPSHMVTWSLEMFQNEVTMNIWLHGKFSFDIHL